MITNRKKWLRTGGLTVYLLAVLMLHQRSITLSTKIMTSQLLKISFSKRLKTSELMISRLQTGCRFHIPETKQKWILFTVDSHIKAEAACCSFYVHPLQIACNARLSHVVYFWRLYSDHDIQRFWSTKDEYSLLHTLRVRGWLDSLAVQRTHR